MQQIGEENWYDLHLSFPVVGVRRRVEMAFAARQCVVPGYGGTAGKRAWLWQ